MPRGWQTGWRRKIEFEAHDFVSAWRNTYACAFFYLVLVLINVGIFSWELFTQSYDGELFMLALDALINACLLGEMALSLYSYGIREYFKSMLNILDFAISWGCTILLVYTLSDLLTAEEDGIDLLETILLITRYFFWLFRLILVFYRSKQKAEFFTEQEDVPTIRDHELNEIREAYEEEGGNALPPIELRSLIDRSISRHEHDVLLQSHDKDSATHDNLPAVEELHRAYSSEDATSQYSSAAEGALCSSDERNKRVGFL